MLFDSPFDRRPGEKKRDVNNRKHWFIHGCVVAQQYAYHSGKWIRHGSQRVGRCKLGSLSTSCGGLIGRHGRLWVLRRCFCVAVMVMVALASQQVESSRSSRPLEGGFFSTTDAAGGACTSPPSPASEKQKSMQRSTALMVPIPQIDCLYSLRQSLIILVYC